jgi:hypothetical protein
MMLVIFRILLVDFEVILRDIHKVCSEEHITDPGYLADRSEQHGKKNTPWPSTGQPDPAVRENRLESVGTRNAGRGWLGSNWQKRTQQEIHKTQYQRPDQGRKKTVDPEARYNSGGQ